MTFSTLIIGVAFLPLFTMTGVSGVIFSPMARTYAFAIGGAILLALTLTPVLASKLRVRRRPRRRRASSCASSTRVYNPLFDAGAAARPSARCAVALVPVVVVRGRSSRCSGGEFMPKLEEGNFWIRATLPMSISLEQSAEVRRADARASSAAAREDASVPCDDENRKHPEVVTVVSQLGRPDDGTDVSGFHNIEFFAPLKPFDEWPRGSPRTS